MRRTLLLDLLFRISLLIIKSPLRGVWGSTVSHYPGVLHLRDLHLQMFHKSQSIPLSPLKTGWNLFLFWTVTQFLPHSLEVRALMVSQKWSMKVFRATCGRAFTTERTRSAVNLPATRISMKLVLTNLKSLFSNSCNTATICQLYTLQIQTTEWKHQRMRNRVNSDGAMNVEHNSTNLKYLRRALLHYDTESREKSHF